MEKMGKIDLGSESRPSHLLRNIVSNALKMRATDIHLETSKNNIIVNFRVDGRLQRIGELFSQTSRRIPTRIKYLAKLKSYLHREPQEGKIDGKEFEFQGYIRVSVYPTIDGEKVALRIFNEESQRFYLDELNFPQDYLNALKEQLLQPEGLLLFTGPAGSGKTTTIYSALKFIASEGRTNIITIEDPVEFRLPEITQTQIDRSVGLDFPQALRSLLRQDPEVIVVGEIRDEITAEIALRAAFTGHLVISTIHTGSVAGTFARLLEMNLEPYLLTSAINLVTAQRLVRVLCKKCQGKGCSYCLQSGYYGRAPLLEFAVVDEEIGEKIKNFTSQQSFLRFLKTKKKIRSLKERAQDMLDAGVTNKEEIKRILGG